MRTRLRRVCDKWREVVLVEMLEERERLVPDWPRVNLPPGDDPGRSR